MLTTGFGNTVLEEEKERKNGAHFYWSNARRSARSSPGHLSVSQYIVPETSNQG
jgi:hypothetical protein